MPGRREYYWSPEAIERLCAMKRAGETGSAMAAAFGVSRNAVAGKIHHLRLANDPRVPPAGPSPCVSKKGRSLVDRLAEWMSIRDGSLSSAAFQLGVSRLQVHAAWDKILVDCGWQAR